MKTSRYLSVILVILCSGYICMAIPDSVNEKIIYIGPERVPCGGIGPQMCLQAKEDLNKNYTSFNDSIDGFCYNPGYEYAIRVREGPVINSFAYGSSKKWILEEVLRKTGNVTASVLEGVNWHLDSYSNKAGEPVCVLDGTEITAIFESGRIAGNGGCNSYGAQYMVEGENLTIDGIMSTLMFCDGTVSEQETNYLSNLEKAASYSISGNMIRILDANKSVMLTYSVVQPLSFTGTEWITTFYNNGKGGLVSILAGSEITAIFGEDGSLKGSAGCNRYTASYQKNDSSIEILSPATTRRSCGEPRGIMKQENDYLSAMQSAIRFDLEGSELTLFNTNNTRAIIYHALNSKN